MRASRQVEQVVHGYLEGAPPLFASAHGPRGEARNVAWVICTPIHYDLIQCYRSMRNLAEDLAGAGFHAMRVHYDGTGESIASTDRDPKRVDAWLESVRRAVTAMKAIPGVESVGIIGVRIGGAFALDTATKLEVSHLVLWEISPGAGYAREMDILASSSPQTLPEGEEANGGLVSGGFWLSAETLADLGKLEIEKMTPLGKPEVLLVNRSDRRASPRLAQHFEKLGVAVTSAQWKGHKEMMALPDKSAVPSEILAGIVDWASARSRTVGARGAGPKLLPETTVDGLRWRVVRFGAREHLFGIRTELESGARGDAVLMLTGGVVPRTAGNGSYVTLARQLAKRGHPVLRMDASYIGESGTLDGTAGDPNEAFPPTLVDDARAGLDVLGNGDAWAFGLCSGAFAAFRVGVQEPRVKGVFILNPVSFYREEKEEMSVVDQTEQMSRYWQVARDPRSWKKLLSGKADMRHLAKVVGARVSSKVLGVKDRIAVKMGRPPKGLARDLDDMITRGASVHLVFSENDPGHAAVSTEVGSRLDALVSKGLVMKVFAKADHNFHEMSSRAEMLAWVESIISRTARG